MVLVPEDAQLAKSIRLSRYATHDEYVWPYTKDGAYTVKSGYWVSTHIVPDMEQIEPPPGSLDLKKSVWKMKIAPKLQHFMWKIIAGALPTGERLCSRMLHIDPMCQRCCLHEESINHILFECQQAQSTWRCANFLNFDSGQVSLEDNIRKMIDIKDTQSFSYEIRLFPFWIIWVIWKSRNEMLFQQKTAHPKDDAERGLQAVSEWLEANPYGEE